MTQINYNKKKPSDPKNKVLRIQGLRIFEGLSLKDPSVAKETVTNKPVTVLVRLVGTQTPLTIVRIPEEVDSKESSINTDHVDDG